MTLENLRKITLIWGAVIISANLAHSNNMFSLYILTAFCIVVALVVSFVVLKDKL